MSLVWATLALLLLLLPGFAFIAGQFAFEPFTREAVPRSTAGELAAALLCAFLIHGTFFLVCGDRVDLLVLLSVLQVQAPGILPLPAIAMNLGKHSAAIVAYLSGTLVAGFGAGVGIGALQRRLGFRPFVQHAWVFELLPSKTEGYVYAYVMTAVSSGSRVLMYGGVLEQFALARDGTFSYLVLRDPTRYYMTLGPTGPATTARSRWRQIGASLESEPHDLRDLTYLVVEGEDIANVVFDRFSYSFGERIEDVGVLLDNARLAEFFSIRANEVEFSAEEDATGATDSPDTVPTDPPPTKPRKRARSKKEGQG